jgi:hypothetical protein
VTQAVAPRRPDSILQAQQRKPLRGRQVAFPMLVMDRERLGRFADQVLGASRHVHHLFPVLSRIKEPPLPPGNQRKGAQRFHANAIAR